MICHQDFDHNDFLCRKEDFCKKNNLKSKEDLTNWLKKTAFASSETEFDEKLLEALKYESYMEQKFGHMTESLFLKKQDELDSATYSLIRVKDKHLVAELFLRIKDENENFGEISKEFSEGPEKNTNGVIGPVAVSQGNPIIQELIKTSQPNELKGPISLGGNTYIIFKLESLHKASLDNVTKVRLAAELFHDWLDEQVKIYINSTKVKYGISK